jgi:DNA-directed RNA polymerase specialized sigma24 family protein
MWDNVRRELSHLDWDAAPSSGTSLLAEWSATVTALLTVRRATAPITRHDDPFALLATAASGAARTGAGTDADPTASLERVRDALDQAALTITSMPPTERGQHLNHATHTAYELAHRLRIQCTDDRVHAWLLAGETALDGALHSPGPRTPTGVGLAAWQSALATATRNQNVPLVRRGVALGHLSILKDVHATIADATRQGALPDNYGRSVLASIHELGRVHQDTAYALEEPSKPSRAYEAVMLRLGTAVGQLAGRPDPHEHPADRLDALLRTGIGQSALVAGLTADPAARAPAERLQRLALEYLANPRMLQRNAEAPAQDSPGRPSPARDRTLVPPSSATREPIVATITPGTVLDSDTVVALCRARDMGTAASGADPARTPAILRSIDPADWPRLVTAGQQAVADLVASVTPMVYALTRGQPNREDLRGEMFVHLMRIAHTYDPTRTDATRWPSYAWETLQHLRWRGVDNTGVPRQRVTQPRRLIGLDGTEPVSRDVRPEDVIVGRAGAEATRDAVNALPTHLREPLVLSMAGHSDHVIGDELKISWATVHRRIAVARRVLHRELGMGDQDDEIRQPDYATRHGPNRSATDVQHTGSQGGADARTTTSGLQDPLPRLRDVATHEARESAAAAWETVPPLPGQLDAPPAPSTPSRGLGISR